MNTHVWFVQVTHRKRRMYKVMVTNLSTGHTYMIRSMTRRGGNRAAQRLIAEMDS